MRKTAITLLVATRREHSKAGPGTEAAFARDMVAHPIAEHTDAANAQHYEVPAEFFLQCLGPQLKYSSCLYRNASDTIAQAEEHALKETAEHADLADGQRILELGCGWGSLSLWMAKTYPNARITSVSNSASQRAFIMARAQGRGLGNLEVITCDMNDFTAPGEFDRGVSVEMFEHMSNWRALLSRVKGWLKPDGRLFIHVFTHKTTPYRFDLNDEADWIGKYFFSGGVMPSHGLMAQFPDLFTVEQDWRWSGATTRAGSHWLEAYKNIGRSVRARGGLRRRHASVALAAGPRHRGPSATAAGMGVSHYMKPAGRASGKPMIRLIVTTAKNRCGGGLRLALADRAQGLPASTACCGRSIRSPASRRRLHLASSRPGRPGRLAEPRRAPDADHADQRHPGRHVLRHLRPDQQATLKVWATQISSPTSSGGTFVTAVGARRWSRFDAAAAVAEPDRTSPIVPRRAMPCWLINGQS